MNQEQLESILNQHRLRVQERTGDGAFADLSSVDLTGVDLRHVNLSNANLGHANLSNANLSRANLSNANLSNANLSGANLSRANLSRANLSRANLSYANLSYANLNWARMGGANLVGAAMREAAMREVFLRYANLSNADLSEVDMTNTDIQGCMGNQREIKTLLISDTYRIVYTSTHLHIGCRCYEISEWWGFDDDTIDEMDEEALEWWKKHKALLQQIIETCPARSRTWSLQQPIEPGTIRIQGENYEPGTIRINTRSTQDEIK